MKMMESDLYFRVAPEKMVKDALLYIDKDPFARISKCLSSGFYEFYFDVRKPFDYETHAAINAGLSKNYQNLLSGIFNYKDFSINEFHLLFAKFVSKFRKKNDRIYFVPMQDFDLEEGDYVCDVNWPESDSYQSKKMVTSDVLDEEEIAFRSNIYACNPLVRVCAAESFLGEEIVFPSVVGIDILDEDSMLICVKVHSA